jgi:hypothetical protein
MWKKLKLLKNNQIKSLMIDIYMLLYLAPIQVFIMGVANSKNLIRIFNDQVKGIYWIKDGAYKNNIIVQEDSTTIGVCAASGVTFANNCWSKTPPSNMRGSGYIVADPLIAKTGDYLPGELTGLYFKILAGSPCINAGDPNYVAEPNETDMDGEQRVMLGRVDMGADEFNPFEVSFNVVSKRRISRTVFEYDCKVTLRNISRFAVRNVQLEMIKASADALDAAILRARRDG